MRVLSYFDLFVVFVVFSPMLFGMVFAFLGGKSLGSTGSGQSESVWHGYGKGLFSCLIAVVSIGILITVVIGFSDLTEAIAIFAFWFLVAMLYILFMSLLGLLLFTMPAFFGYAIGRQAYVSKMIELDARKSAAELAEEIRRKEKVKPHLS